MVIKNEVNAAKINIAYVLSIGIAVIVFGLSWIPYPEFINVRPYGILISLLLFAFHIVLLLFNLNYIHYSDGSNIIRIRYFNIHFLLRKKMAIEIAKNVLAGVQVKKSLLGLRKDLILFQKTKNTITRYPPVGISALSRGQVEQLEKQLQMHVLNNK